MTSCRRRLETKAAKGSTTNPAARVDASFRSAVSSLVSRADHDDEADPMNRLSFLHGLTTSVLVALLVTGCSALAQSASPSAASPPLHRALGGGYVPGDTTYHGSGGR